MFDRGNTTKAVQVNEKTYLSLLGASDKNKACNNIMSPYLGCFYVLMFNKNCYCGAIIFATMNACTFLKYVKVTCPIITAVFHYSKMILLWSLQVKKCLNAVLTGFNN